MSRIPSTAGQFGKLPFWVVASGRIATLTRRSEVAVYAVVVGHVNGKTWRARLSIERIARLAGITERTAYRAIEGLELQGLITVESGGGRSHINTYVLAQNPVTPVRVSTENPDTARRETLTRRDVNPVTGVRGTDKNRDSNSSRSADGAAAGAVADLEVLEELTVSGIGNPTRARLAALPDITADLVRRSRERTSGKSPAVTICEIEAAVEAKAAQRAQRGRRQVDSNLHQRLKRCNDVLSYATEEQRAIIDGAYRDRAALCRAVGDDVLLGCSVPEALSMMLEKARAGVPGDIGQAANITPTTIGRGTVPAKERKQ